MQPHHADEHDKDTARVSLDELWREVRRTGDERAKAELTRRVMAFVVPLAERVRWEMAGRPNLADLVGAGVLGLFEALERFDPARGVSFEVFCGWRVFGAMHDDQQKNDWAPHAVRAKAQRLRAVRDELLAVAGARNPTDEELADAMGIPVAEVGDLWRRSLNPTPVSIERAAPPGADTLDPAFVEEGLDPARLLLAAEARSILLDTVKALPENHRYVLLLYYFENLTLAQIGLVLDLSESRVCQIRQEAMGKLVQRLGRRKEELLDAFGS